MGYIIIIENKGKRRKVFFKTLKEARQYQDILMLENNNIDDVIEEGF